MVRDRGEVFPVKKVVINDEIDDFEDDVKEIKDIFSHSDVLDFLMIDFDFHHFREQKRLVSR
jgi:hypothetical protein